MPESYLFGYDFQSTQPCVRVELTLKLGAMRETQHIDAWLRDHFKMKEESIASTTKLRKGDRGALAHAVTGRALALYGELARAAGIPCFDKGRTLRLDAVAGTPGNYRAVLSLPVIDNMNLSLFEQVLDTAVRLVLNPLKSPPTRKEVDRLFDQLDREFIAKLKGAHPFGTSTISVCELAHRQSIPCRHIGGGNIRLGWGSNSRLLNRSAIQSDSAIGATICGNKRLTAHILKATGFPVPDHAKVGSREAALETARRFGWPVVVKPEDRDRSEGVTVDVASDEALQAAYDAAREFSEHILVERQLPGFCNRLIVAGDRIVYAVLRMPKGVKGNGEDTIAKLMEIADAKELAMPPWKRFKRYALDDMEIECLTKQGFTPQSVPEEGKWAFVRNMSTDAWGGETQNVTKNIHPDNARLAIDVARNFGLTVAGVDLMTEDIAVPWHENGGRIIELNYRPQFYSQGREEEANALMPMLIEGDGRIPVHLVTGEGDLLTAATELKSRLEREGRKCHLTSAEHTEDGDGRVVALEFSSLLERGFALTMRTDVSELILIGQPGELFARGLPVDRLENVLVVDGDTARGERTAREIDARFRARSIRGTSLASV